MLMLKIGFYYQIWYTNQRSIFENLKQFRKVFPTDRLYLVVAGIDSSDTDLFLSNFGNKLKEHFNITKIEFLYSNKIRSMPTISHRFNSMGISIRDGYNEFNNIWVEKLIETVDKDIDILVNCSDDWFVMEKFKINLDQDISCRLTDWSDWMSRGKILKYIGQEYSKVPWMQHGHYFNFQKFLKKYTKENIELINNAIKDTYPENLPIFLDYYHALWNMVAFDTFENSLHILEFKKDPFEKYGSCPIASFHGFTGFRNLKLSKEMTELGFKEYN